MKLQNLFLIMALGTTSVFAQTSLTSFSPYADLTINAHWDPQYNDMEPMDLTTVSQTSGVKNFHLAFITDAGNCTPAWGGQAMYSAPEWGSHLTDKMRTNGIHYTVAFGGASGNDISMACSDAQLVTAFENIVKTYQPEGLDFDIENGTANVAKIMTALKQTQRSHPDLKISFTLPTLPEGLTASGKDIVNQAKTSNLNFTVNVMAMDYGPAYTNSMGEYGIQAATSLFNFLKEIYPNKSDADLWKMVEVTSMIGVNDVNVEQFTLKDVDVLRHFADQNHLGMLSIWSVARDNPCDDKWASPVCSGNNLQSKPYEFSERFNQ